MNTRNSALQAIDCGPLFTSVFLYYRTSNALHLYGDLHDCIQGALQEKHIIELDLAQTDARTNANLRAILKQNQKDNYTTLTKFINQFINFGELPSGCRDTTYHLRKSIAANAHPTNIKQRILFWKWAQEPEHVNDSESDDFAEASQPVVLQDLDHFVVDASKCCVAKIFKHGK